MTVHVAAEPAAMSLLRSGVPLSLLCDLLEPGGPESREIYSREVGRPGRSGPVPPRVESAPTRR